MRDRKEYNEQIDDFSRLVKQKLDSHRIPVDADSWAEIEQRLQPRGQSRRQRLWWMAGAAAAVAVLVTVFFFRPQDDIGQQPVTVGQTQPADHNEPTSAEPKQEPVKEPVLLVPGKEDQTAGSVRLFSQRTDSATTSRGNNTMVGIEKSLSTDSVPKVNDRNLSQFITDAGSGTKTSDSVPAKTMPDVRQNDLKRKEEPKVWLTEKKTNNKNREWLLAAAFSANGNSSSKDGNGRMSYAYNSSIKSELMSEGSKTPIAMASDPSELKASHALPLSFGVSVRKNLTNRIGVETGLVYTYLSTKFSSVSVRGESVDEAKQELHYLGIPVNMVVSLWDDPRWSVYVSGGAMAEKGLRRNYSYSGNTTSTNASIKEGISGVQWSVNASVGVSYRFYQDWGVYVEPRYSYYFDNNQPVSIRTDKKNVFGLSGGVRFEF